MSPPVSSSPPPSPLRLLFFLSCRSGSDRRPRRRSGGISEEDEKGLKNLGNSCYLNSITDTPPLAQFYLSSRRSSLSSRKKLCVARKQMFIHEHPMCLSYSSRDLKARMVQKLTGESNLMEFLGYQSSCVT
ncbi:unnamed protein product [Musa acuminata subsp. burmannicoides]